MKKIKENLNLIVGLLTLLFIGFIVYNSFFKKEESKNIEDVVVGEINPDTKKILNVLDKIDNIKIDNSFFNEAIKPEGYSLVFSQLEDFSQPIPNKRPGKVNPFIKGGAISYLDEASDNVLDGGETNSDSNNNQVVQEEIIEN